MIKLTSKWRKLVTQQLERSNKKPSKNAWVSPLMMISSIQVETRGDDSVDNVSERVLHRVARKIRMMRPHGQLYSVPNPYKYKPVMPRAAKAASAVAREYREYPAWAYAPSTISSVDDWLSPKPAKPKSLAQDRQAALTKTLRK